MSVVTRSTQRRAALRLGCSTRANCTALIEPLEGRTLMTAVVVNTTLDTPHPAGMVSLRDAIAVANTSATPTTISFDANVFATPKTITLNGNELGLAAKTTTINAPSAGVTIDGNNLSRIFHVLPGGILSLSGLTLTHARNGAIFNSGTLTIAGCAISGNTGLDGAGLFNAGTATLNNVTVSGNSAPGGEGGGIYNDQSGKLTLTNDTLSGNSAFEAGGIYNNGVATLTDVTIAKNLATQRGGAISDDQHGAMTLASVTISLNAATNDYGGGIFIRMNGSVSIANTIIAGNTTRTPTYGPDISGIAKSRGFNLIGDFTSSTGWMPTDRLGTTVNPINAGLGALANNGGPTLTMTPLAGSPAIDHGANGYIQRGNTSDQRGRPRITNLIVDIGAVEVQRRIWAPPIWTPASIKGLVFRDGLRDARQQEMGPRQVFLDLDQNGVFDKRDLCTTTDSKGNWSFTNLAAGTYTVRLVPVDGLVADKATEDGLTIKLLAGQVSAGNLFGERAIV